MANRLTKQKWEIIRAKGLARYLVSFAVLKIGIISGAIFASLPYEIGFFTHAYSMSIWMLALVFVILTLVFTVGFGCLFWHLNEKGFHAPNTDNQLPILNTITKDALRIIDRKMNHRGLYRRLLVLPLLIFILVGLSIVPHSSPHRDFFIWGILAVAWIYLISFIVFLVRGIKADCYEFGALCPKCGKPLYIGMGIRNGRCPSCDYQLFEDIGA